MGPLPAQSAIWKSAFLIVKLEFLVSNCILCVSRTVGNNRNVEGVESSNGKSSIVEERLYSFFFALFQKNEASFFSFFFFFAITNEDVRFASIL